MLNPPQSEVVRVLTETPNVSLIVATKPGTGKSLIARYAIERQREDKVFTRAIILEPLKALTAQMARDLTTWFPRLKVIEVSSDTAEIIGKGVERNQSILEADIAVFTYESFEVATRHPETYTFLPEISLLYVDEIQSLKDDRRGGTLDTGLTRYLLSHGANVQFIAASGTVANYKDLKDWLEGMIPQVKVIHSDFSPVKADLDPNIYVYARGNTTRAELLAQLAIDAVKQKQDPVIVMTLNRSLTWSIAKKIQEVLGPNAANVHHAGLNRDERARIEESFRRKLLPVLVSTPTLAAGVNTPCRKAIVDTTYWDVTEFRNRCVTIGNILQIMGRAGRLPDWTHAYVQLAAMEDPHWNQKVNLGVVSRVPDLEPKIPEFEASEEVLLGLKEFAKKLNEEQEDWVKRRAARSHASPYEILKVIKDEYEKFKGHEMDEQKALQFAMIRAKVEAPGAEHADKDPTPLEELEKQLNSPSLVVGSLMNSMEAAVNSQIAMAEVPISSQSIFEFLKRTYSWNTARERRWGSSCRILSMDHNLRNKALRYHVLEGAPLAFLPPTKVKVIEGPLQDKESQMRFTEALDWLSKHRYTGQKDGDYVSETKGILTHRSGLHPQRVETVLSALARAHQDVLSNGAHFVEFLAEAYDCKGRRDKLELYASALRMDWIAEEPPYNASESSVSKIVWFYHPEERLGDDVANEIHMLDLVVRPLTAGTFGGEVYRVLRQWASNNGIPPVLCEMGAWFEEHKVYNFNAKRLLMAYLNGARIINGQLVKVQEKWRVPLEVQGMVKIANGQMPEIRDYRDDTEGLNSIMRGFDRTVNLMAKKTDPSKEG